jgi:hypothetical protein
LREPDPALDAEKEGTTMPATTRRRPAPAHRGIPAPIVFLPLADLATDDRTYNGWVDFFALLPLEEPVETDAAAAGG